MPIDAAVLTQSVSADDAGGVVTFLGTVRRTTGGEITEALEYEAYEAMAIKELQAIENAARERWPVAGFRLVHRLGRLGVGDISVAVAVSCPHRVQAFEACRFAIDALKERVPIWKRDIRPDGSTEWVMP